MSDQEIPVETPVRQEAPPSTEDRSDDSAPPLSFESGTSEESREPRASESGETGVGEQAEAEGSGEQQAGDGAAGHSENSSQKTAGKPAAQRRTAKKKSGTKRTNRSPKKKHSPRSQGDDRADPARATESGDTTEEDVSAPASASENRSDDSQVEPASPDGEDGGDPAEKRADGARQPARKKSRKERFLERKERERAKEAAALEAAPAVESEGLVEISPKGFGFLRERGRNFQQSPKDVFITPEIVRIHGLRDGLWLKCVSKQGLRGPQLIDILAINGREPGDYDNLPYFEELTAINPNKKLTLETTASRMTTRVIDLMAPIGRGQRGLIVAPPRTGKTTILHHTAEAILENYEDMMHLMILLVDERPEEVTDFQRSFPDVEVFSSSNDGDAKDHTRIALLAIERAKRLVEAGEHVFILMDSITRLARAFNSSMRGGGNRGTGSGGVVVGALEIPRRIFAAARNTREAGSLTILATALVQTNSKADEAIFQEFKGTCNMELVLDRQLAQNYVYPAVDIHRSGTRREELLLAPHILEKIHVIRRGLGGHKPIDAMEWLLKCMERYPSNAQMLMDIKTTALS